MMLNELMKHKDLEVLLEDLTEAKVKEFGSKDYQKVEALTKHISTLLGIKLKKDDDGEMSDQEAYDKTPKEYGIYYKVIDTANKLTASMDPYLVLYVSVDDKFQFFYDATPLPTSLHTKSQSQKMTNELNEYPLSISKLTKDVYDDLIKNFKNREDNFNYQKDDSIRKWETIDGVKYQITYPPVNSTQKLRGAAEKWIYPSGQLKGSYSHDEFGQTKEELIKNLQKAILNKNFNVR